MKLRVISVVVGDFKESRRLQRAFVRIPVIWRASSCFHIPRDVQYGSFEHLQQRFIPDASMYNFSSLHLQLEGRCNDLLAETNKLFHLFRVIFPFSGGLSAITELRVRTDRSYILQINDSQDITSVVIT